ncbi:tripartite-type tricarboxylate transporter receptor subunit TctC [Paralcaligenes ureilyticus]|uniref:Tripartite-type tricarboxylate transporter receptor subunit TctC n=2 Tax=Paralcaligenes ureilyticus TaxID=627131 RepID=A0A4R3LSZ2_9BURK|nr:tripartite-type tricarboxylate transporter receptor subunit TctC [Paralcaligenes ureilyticus]
MFRFMSTVVCTALLCAATQVYAAYPDKTIRMIIPLAAGSAVDNAARVLAERMSANMGVSIILENEPGASGQIGASQVARAAPDGYTIGGFNDSIMTMLPNVRSHLPWDILKDFEPVSLVATVEWGLVASRESPYQSAADVIKAAKASPGKINYGSGGIGSPQHIAMALFSADAGISLRHVPYKGATQAAVAVAGNEVSLAFQGLATVTALVNTEKVRLIGVTTPSRMPQYPNVPTISESGLKGFQFNSWFTIVAPAGTPKNIIDRLNAEVVKALKDPKVIERYAHFGLTPRGSTAQELGAETRSQLARYHKLIHDAGIAVN